MRLCACVAYYFFFFKQKTAYEMRISDWSSDVCSVPTTTTFEGEPLYRVDQPDEAEITQRLSLYHRPYHDTLTAELDRLKAAHGKVVLYDAHSIRSHVPRLFDGELPQFNIGTNGGATAAPELDSVVEIGRAHV